jgi:phosphatidate cytidylyltransferase
VTDSRDDDRETPAEDGARPRETTTPEGVRILGAEEAQAAMEAGQVGRRLADDDVRYGDVPPRPDPGLRPAARFPLPSDVSPPTPRVTPASPRDGAPGEPDGDEPAVVEAEVDEGGEPSPWSGGAWDRDVDDAGDEWDTGDDRVGYASGTDAQRGAWRDDEPVEAETAFDAGDDGVVRVNADTTGSMALPHWTEPPTGEVPQILSEAEPVDLTGEEDLDAWNALAAAGSPRFRTDAEDWAESDFDFGRSLRGDEDVPLGALAAEVDEDESFEQEVAARRHRRRTPARPAATEHAAITDDEHAATAPAADTEPGVGRPGARPARRPPPRPQRPPNGAPPGAPDLSTRIVTGIAVAVVALICLKLGRGPATALVAVIVGLASLELYEAFRRAGHRPATVLGLLGSITIVVAAYKRGLTAFPDIGVLVLMISMLWYLAGVVRARANVNIGLTLLGFGYVGGLGAFAGLLLGYRDGVGMILGMAICAVGYDIFGYLVGSQFGRTRVAPDISPNKTLEGLIAGMVAAVVLGVIVSGVIGLSPWDGKVTYGLALGVVVAVLAPLGDLCESMLKRDLGVKDLGSILPGHGGVLDRFDAMLFCLPAIYYLVRYLGIA